MADLKYTPVPHDQKAFLAKARARKGFKEAYDALALDYQVASNLKPGPMGKPVEVLEAELLQLSKADRIRFLDRVVASLDADAARDAAWEAVAARRDAEAERDPSALLPLDAVLAELRAEVQ